MKRPPAEAISIPIGRSHQPCLPVISLALLLALLHGAAPGAAVSTTVPEPRVNPRTVKIPIVDGKDIPFARLSTIDGLSQTKVSWIVQDDQGFLWLGTQYGLNRYDGHNFKVFVPDPNDSNSLSGVFITVLFKARDGTLWVGCDHFLHRFEPATESFKRYPIPFVTHISQDSAGMLWLSTGGGLYSLDPAQGTVRQYQHDPQDPSSLTSNAIKSSGEDRTGRFWVSSAKGLDEFDRKRAVVTLHIPLRESSREYAFYEDLRGVFWIIDLYRNAFAVFDRENNTLTRYSLEEPQSRPMLAGITSIVEDRNGALWLGTHGAGLLKYDRDHQRFTRYRHDPADPDSIAQNNVEHLFADREGSMWAALGSMGITRFTTKALPFRRVPRRPDEPNAKIERFVGALYADRQGIVWVGTPHALNRIDARAGSYTSYRPTANSAAGTDVIAIRADRSGSLWIGTYSHGLFRFEPRTGSFTKVYRHDPDDPNSLSSDIIPRLLVDHSGTLWAATADGLNRFDAATGRFTVYKVDPRSRSQSYLDLVEDRDGALWLGTDSSGLHRFDPATGRFTVYEHRVNSPGTLSDNRVNSVLFTRAGTMWVGTQNGLNEFDPKTGAFTVYGRRDGLPGNAIGCVLEDDHEGLWMSTNNGVARFNPKSKSVKSYSTADGLPGPDLTGWGACAKSVAGEMFFGGFSGATAFFPENVTDSVDAPPIVLTDFRLFGLPVALTGGSPLTKAINYTDTVTLSYDQNIFSIGFAALSYLNSATNRYRYMLEPFDRQWNEVGSDERRASYTTLPAGTYTLRVQAATGRGTWSEPGAQLRIEILPPWWRAAWLSATYVALLVLIAWALYYYRLRRLEAAMGARFDERLAERTRIARELHDTLIQTIQGSKLVVEDALDHDGDAVHTRRALERLSGWLEQAIHEGRVALNSLRTSTTQRNDLVEALRRATENSGHPGSIAVALSVIGDAKEMHPIVRDEVYRLGYEAIRNAYQHSKGSRLTVELTYSQDLSLRVADNGIGIEPVVADKGKTGHFGLQGMRERAARIGGKLTLVSSRASGTEIELVVPGRIIFRPASRVRHLGLGRMKALLRFKDRKSSVE